MVGKGALLEVINYTEVEVVARELEAKAIFAIRAVFIISLTITEEASVSNEVEVLAKGYLYTRLNTYAPTYLSVRRVVAYLRLISRYAKAHVEEEANRAKLNV